jgi:hypothetical protein
MATVMLLVSQAPERRLEWVGALRDHGGVRLVLLLAERIQRLLGERVVQAFERLMGLILVAVSVEMLLRGLKVLVPQLRAAEAPPRRPAAPGPVLSRASPAARMISPQRFDCAGQGLEPLGRAGQRLHAEIGHALLHRRAGQGLVELAPGGPPPARAGRPGPAGPGRHRPRCCFRPDSASVTRSGSWATRLAEPMASARTLPL